MPYLCATKNLSVPFPAAPAKSPLYKTEDLRYPSYHSITER